MKLLLAEDNDSNRLTTCALLEDEGFEVDCAASFAEAKALLSNDEPTYQVALLDEHLGDGLGSELARALRARGARVRIVLLSGSADPITTSSTFDATVTKGGKFGELVALIKRLGAEN
jgi:two-component system, response regulator RegA